MEFTLPRDLFEAEKSISRSYSELELSPNNKNYRIDLKFEGLRILPEALSFSQSLIKKNS